MFISPQRIEEKEKICTSAKTAEKRKVALDYTQARIKIASVKRPTLTGFVR